MFKEDIIISNSDGNSCSDSDESCNSNYSDYRRDANCSGNTDSDNNNDNDLLFSSTSWKGKRKISDAGNVTFE